MTIHYLRIARIVCFWVMLPFAAVNTWQAVNGYNLPGSAAVAALNIALMVALVVNRD